MSLPAPPTALTAKPSSSLLEAPTIITVSLPAAQLGQLYTGTISATGGLSPYTWAINAGQLPPGLVLQASTSTSVGIVGTPTTLGSFTFAILCTDALQQTAQAAITMEHTP